MRFFIIASKRIMKMVQSCVFRLCLLILVLPTLVLNDVRAGTLTVDVAGVDLTVALTSFSESRFLNTIKQEHDFSCGSAAVATLLSFHYEHAVNEAEAFQAMYETGDKALIRRVGFSLLDIKHFLKGRGFESDGFRFSLNRLRKIAVPAIVLINDDGYKHFVVIKGVDDHYVLLGDPAKGTRYMARPEFESLWNGIVFLVRNKKDVGERYFNAQEPSGLIARAPFGSVVSRHDMQGNSFSTMFGRVEF